MTTTYRRTASFDQETLEDELVVMETESQAVVTLNPTGQMVWEAIADGATATDIEAVFREAFPDVDPATLGRDVRDVLDTLVAADLAIVEDG